jgi:hypothetical protein
MFTSDCDLNPDIRNIPIRNILIAIILKPDKEAYARYFGSKQRSA